MYYVFTKNLLGAHFCKKYCFLVVLVVVVVEVSSKYKIIIYLMLVYT